MVELNKSVRHVALAYPVAVPWMALFMRGVADYADRHGGYLLWRLWPPLQVFMDGRFILRIPDKVGPLKLTMIGATPDNVIVTKDFAINVTE